MKAEELYMDERVKENLTFFYQEISSFLKQSGGSSIYELLKFVNLYDRQLVAVLDRGISEGIFEFKDGRFYKVGFQRIHEYDKLSRDFFTPHSGSLYTHELWMVLYSKFEQLTLDRPKEVIEYDQRQVNIRTTLLRALYMLYRGDLCSKRIAIIGDDDLTSIGLALVGGFSHITVFEIDNRLCDFLQRFKSNLNLKNFEVCNHSALEALPAELMGGFDVVLCDPSRSLYEAFLFRAEELLNLAGVLYTFIMPSHSDIFSEFDFQKLLLDREWLITDIIPKFNEYYRDPSSLEENYSKYYSKIINSNDSIRFTESLLRAVRQKK